MKSLYVVQSARKLLGRTTSSRTCTTTTQGAMEYQERNSLPIGAARLLISLILLLVMQGIAWGQGSLGSYSTTGLSGIAATISPSSISANVTFSPFSRGAGITGLSVSDAFRSNGWQTGVFDSSNNDYYEFTITPASCYSLSLTAIRFDLLSTKSQGANNGGPTTVILRSSNDSYAANIDGTKSVNDQNSEISFNVSSLANLTSSVTFRLYGYSAENNNGTLTVQNISSSSLGVEVDGSVSLNGPAQPSAISGDTAPCLGSSQTYSVIPVSGVNYSWALPTGWTGSSTTHSITVTVGSGSGNLTVTPSNVCGVGTPRTLAVSVITPLAPSVTDQIICTGNTVTFRATGAVPGDHYKWYDATIGGTLLKTSTNSTDDTFTTINLNSTTSYGVSIFTSAGCESARTQLTATVSNPIASVMGQTNISCFGAQNGSITISASGGTPPYSYSVDNGTTWVLSSTNPYPYEGLKANTPYKIRVKDGNGCESIEIP